MIDLDKSRAARREAAGEGPVVKFAGREYKLDPELPFGVLEGFRDLTNKTTQPGALWTIVRALMGKDNCEQMEADGLAVGDLDDLIEGVMSEYGVNNPLPSSAS